MLFVFDFWVKIVKYGRNWHNIFYCNLKKKKKLKNEIEYKHLETTEIDVHVYKISNKQWSLY